MRHAAMLAFAAMVFCAPAHAATWDTINFSGVDPNNSLPLENTRGDFDSATVDYRTIASEIDNPNWGDLVSINGDPSDPTDPLGLVAPGRGYADLDGPVFSYFSNRRGEIRITAKDPGKRVGIWSFDIGSLLGVTANWKTFDLNWNLVSEGSDRAPAAATFGGVPEPAKTIYPWLNSAAGAPADGIILQWGDAADVGIDHITFYVLDPGDPLPIPLPPALALSILGLGALRLLQRQQSG